MPLKGRTIRTICATRDCPRPALVGRPRCADHHREHERDRARNRHYNSTDAGYDARWRRTRTTYLRHHPTCTACHARATQVDHVDGLGPHGPQGHDPANLRAFCASCHSRRTATDQRTTWRDADTRPLG